MFTVNSTFFYKYEITGDLRWLWVVEGKSSLVSII